MNSLRIFPKGKAPTMTDYDFTTAYDLVLSEARDLETMVVISMCAFLALSIIICVALCRKERA